jgi:hypothetical protein
MASSSRTSPRSPVTGFAVLVLAPGAIPITSQPHGVAPQGGAVLVVLRSYRCGIQIVHPISDSAAEVSSQPRCFTERRRTDT